MKTHEHITPEQQIANQKAEIESLQRKVEGLEKELQQCLDPDSGEINPSVKYHFKSGEAALLEQVAELQSQLDDCLENELGWMKNNAFKSVILNTIAAQFMPVDKYNPYRKEWFEETPRDIWQHFRSAIFEGDRSATLLQSQAFRDVIGSMNNFLEDMAEERAAGFELFTSSADVLLENTTAEGWELAIQSLNLEQTNESSVLGTEDYEWLKFTMLNICRCVKMWQEAKDRPEAVGSK